MLIFRRFLVQAGDFIKYGVCKLKLQFATAANRFHKELRFFFSLLKRKKEAKKEKNSPTLILHGNASHEDLSNKNPPAGHTGGCCRRNITLFTVEIGA